MGEIRHLSHRDFSRNGHLERIVAAAKADAGFWLMVKEREMERQAMRAVFDPAGSGQNEIDKLAPARLTPTIAELADDLVSRMFGICPPEMLTIVEQALLDTARVELSVVK
ncbi:MULTISPECIES: hypothetical protein [Rhizobium]|uniref:Uncharacterized protein n=2 Tax=Rhizobium leguminosarum TaxID=384 RepID=E7EJA2_RHILV|nr:MULTISPECIES: hypothetical protein [Rhizobium]ADV31322.1 hypothetical protein [Rhizobium leguminosarum bv. viciae]MBY3185578.1 hypothetical protein [Rhizobium laguerreae]NEI96146.1 hypothetical protein [Rhizobium leguminosarum]NEK54699.1 hypothetical protein [Rhizobium leguminosarum]NKM29724.1 hypothetical protein [Rhizobium laguerreae]